nr:protein HGH1 homolog [Lytechinus pictus]
MMADASVIEELIQFLSVTIRPDVRDTALAHVTGTTASKEGRLTIGTQLLPVAETVGELICSDAVHESHQEQAYHIVVNLSSEDSFAEKLALDLSYISHLLQTIINPSSPFAKQACMILSNLTRNRAGAERVLKILQHDDDESPAVGMNKLVEAFCKEGYNKKNSSLDYVGPLLANLTQLTEAREFVLNRERCIVQRLLPFTQYKLSMARRRGVATALRNCCFETASHEWLLGDDVDILPHLLLPLAGPEELSEEDMEGLPDDLQYLEETKKREDDPDIRGMLLEAIYQLCASKEGRRIVKEKRTYVILREYHQWEKDEKVESLCHQVIDVLIMDEPLPGMENLRDVEIPEEIKVKLDQKKEVEDQQKD